MEKGEFFRLTNPFHQEFREKMKASIPTEFRRWNDEEEPYHWEIGWEYLDVLEKIVANTIAFENKPLNFEWLEPDHLVIKFS